MATDKYGETLIDRGWIGYCKKCGTGPMVLKEGKNYDPFWGCTDYPNCGGTSPINPASGIPFGETFEERRFIND